MTKEKIREEIVIINSKKDLEELKNKIILNFEITEAIELLEMANDFFEFIESDIR